jgi:membrane-associated phospholipid phosphatase
MTSGGDGTPADIPWSRPVSRVLAQWRLKALLTAGLLLGYCVPYFVLQRVTFFPVRTFAPSPLDRAVAFAPAWVFAYQSLYLFMPIMPWLAASRDQLARYARGLVAMSLAAFLVFILYPVAGPRPQDLSASSDVNTAFRLLLRVDTPLNSFPSMHAGMTAYSLLFGLALLRGAPWPARAAYGVAAGAWGLAILYSTLATKQHFAIDLPAGILFACAAHAWAWHGAAIRPRAANAGKGDSDVGPILHDHAGSAVGVPRDAADARLPGR